LSLNIISRAAWGARSWRSPVHSVPMSQRTHFLVHYHGGVPRHDRGDASAKEIEAIHLANGWTGVGYNFIVGQDGEIREGRGWNLVGAHCPGHNTNGIGVYVAVGGDQEATEEAKASVVALYNEASRLAGHALVKSYHGADYATACPGKKLIAWVKAGMPLVGKAPVIKAPVKVVVSKVISKVTGKLVVDGAFGPATVKAWQKVMGTPVDGKISRPSTLIAKVQRQLGIKADGLLGPQTWRAIQRRLGVTADGVPGPITIKALQRRLNTGKF
jgi:N-acetylmuramoyl-L-alanine amidase